MHRSLKSYIIVVVPILILIVHVNFSTGQDSQTIDGVQLENLIHSLITDGLGMDEFHNRMREFSYISSEEVNAQEVVAGIQKAIQNRLLARVGQLEQIVKFARDSYNTFVSAEAYEKCCETKLPDDKFDSRRKIKVDDSAICYSLAATSPSDPKLPPVSLLDLFKEIEGDAEDVQNLYLATEEGILFTYPSFDTDFQCNQFDPRLRPYYIDTVTTKSKDLVILVDWTDATQVATLEGVDMFSVAVKLVHNILGGFNDRDRVLLIPFGERLLDKKPTKFQLSHTCFLSDFAEITDRLKQEITAYLNSLEPTKEPGLLSLSEQFEKAFDHLQKLNNPDRENLVIFISGVLPDERLEKVYTSIDELRSRAVSHTALFYQLGNDPNVTKLFQEIQKHLKAVSYYEVFDDPYKLDVRMYKHFILNKHEAEVSPPFIEAVSKVLTQGISLPIFLDETTLYGIAVMEVSVENLYKELYEFKAGRHSYMFAFDLTDKSALFHHLLPQQQEDLTPPYIPIGFLENLDNLPDITTGVEQHEVLNAKRIIPKGNPDHYGVISQDIAANYTCSLAESGTWRLAFCLVLESGDQSLTRGLAPDLKETGQGTAFFYHRFDFEVQKTGEICRSFYRQVFETKTAVKLASKAFKYPVNYIQFAETKSSIQNYVDVISGSVPDEVFKPGVVDDIFVTSVVNDMWLSGKHQYDNITYAVWRYVGTHLGVHRVQPAVILDKEYDPTNRPWYQKAIGLKGFTTVTAPYLDEFGAGYIVSIARALYETDGKTAFGVMSIDVTVQYLYLLAETSFALDCVQAGFECFLMDDGGYIVVHKSWVETETAGEIEVENVHIAKLEPEIAAHMLSRGYLKRVHCVNLFTFAEHVTYTVNIPKEGVEHKEGSQLVYKAVYAPFTNIYLVQKSTRDNSLANTCTCYDDNLCRHGLDSCECPCERPPPTGSCITGRTDVSPCTPVAVKPLFLVDAPPQTYATAKVHYSETEFCIHQKCADQQDLPSCQAINHCRWCTHDNEGKKLYAAYCGQYDQCWFGQEDRSLYIKPIQSDDPILDPLMLLGVTIALTVGIIVFLIIVRLHLTSQSGDFDDENDSELIPPDEDMAILKRFTLEVAPEGRLSVPAAGAHTLQELTEESAVEIPHYVVTGVSSEEMSKDARQTEELLVDKEQESVTDTDETDDNKVVKETEKQDEESMGSFVDADDDTVIEETKKESEISSNDTAKEDDKTKSLGVRSDAFFEIKDDFLNLDEFEDTVDHFDEAEVDTYESATLTVKPQVASRPSLLDKQGSDASTASHPSTGRKSSVASTSRRRSSSSMVKTSGRKPSQSQGKKGPKPPANKNSKK